MVEAEHSLADARQVHGPDRLVQVPRARRGSVHQQSVVAASGPVRSRDLDAPSRPTGGGRPLRVQSTRLEVLDVERRQSADHRAAIGSAAGQGHEATAQVLSRRQRVVRRADEVLLFNGGIEDNVERVITRGTRRPRETHRVSPGRGRGQCLEEHVVARGGRGGSGELRAGRVEYFHGRPEGNIGLHYDGDRLAGVQVERVRVHFPGRGNAAGDLRFAEDQRSQRLDRVQRREPDGERVHVVVSASAVPVPIQVRAEGVLKPARIGGEAVRPEAQRPIGDVEIKHVGADQIRGMGERVYHIVAVTEGTVAARGAQFEALRTVHALGVHDLVEHQLEARDRWRVAPGAAVRRQAPYGLDSRSRERLGQCAIGVCPPAAQ